MIRDVCYFFETDVQSLYRAYLKAAGGEQFRGECGQEAYNSFAFGLNYPDVYNISGGVCKLSFIPYKNGSAVNISVSCEEADAKFGKFAEDLTQEVANLLCKAAYYINIAAEEFAKENSGAVQGEEAEAKTDFQNTATSKPNSQLFIPRFCTNCGNALKEGTNFCSNCGAKINPIQINNA